MISKITVILILFIGMLFSPITIAHAVCGTPAIVGGVSVCQGGGGNISPSAVCPRNSTVCCSSTAECSNVIPIENITDSVDNAFFDSLNPLKTEGSPFADQLSSPGGIVSRILEFLFPMAGLVLFVMIIWGGFEILVKSGQGAKAIEAGKNRITASIIGFFLLFATYWMAQIIEIIFGVVIV